jgi:hypothetical protein
MLACHALVFFLDPELRVYPIFVLYQGMDPVHGITPRMAILT